MKIVNCKPARPAGGLKITPISYKLTSMNLNYFDAHSHLNFPQYDEDREEIIKDMKSLGFATICVGTDKKTSKESVDLANRHENIWATIGVHPTDSTEGFDSNEYSNLLSDKVVGVGECGLDYFRLAQTNADGTQTNAEKVRQKDVFERQIQFALENNLPLMLHMRPSAGTMDAYIDGLLILESYVKDHGEKVRGNSHFFVGDIDISKKFLNIGFTMSFDGPITFASDYDEVIRYIPEDMILAETDSPFASPVPHRGQRNSPLYVKYIMERIANIRGEDVGVLSKILVNNTLRVFSINTGSTYEVGSI